MKYGLPIVNIGMLMGMSARDRTQFGKRMYDSRKAAKLTQAQVCKAIHGVSQSNLSELERLYESSGDTAAFAKLYGVDAHWLATGKGEPCATARWPFAIAYGRFDHLTDQQKLEIQGALRKMILDFEATALYSRAGATIDQTKEYVTTPGDIDMEPQQYQPYTGPPPLHGKERRKVYKPVAEDRRAPANMNEDVK